MKPSHLSLLAALALVGCSAMPGQQPVTAYGYLRPTGQDGRLLAVVSPWTAQDIDHAVLTLSSGDTLVSTLTIAKADLARRVVFANLKQATTYTVQARAYHDASGTVEIDDASVLPTSCTTTFTTSLDPDVTFGNIALQLLDRTFSGSATGGLSVRAGQVLNPTEGEAIAFSTRTLSVFAGATSSMGTLDGTGTSARFNFPRALAVDASGTIYVADSSNNEIRKITPEGVVSTFAGSTTAGSADGTGTAARFNFPTGVAVDASGTVFVADLHNQEIRKITPAGVVSTFAGATTTGNVDGSGPDARFNYPYGVAVDASGTVFVADEDNDEIRKITPAGVVSTLAGSTTAGSADGTGADARLNTPLSVAVDANDDVYVADENNNEIRKITPAGVVSTLAGSTTAGSADGTGASARFDMPVSVAVDRNGNLYVADYLNHAFRYVTPSGAVTTLATGLRLPWGVGTGASGVYLTNFDQILTLR